MKPQQPQQHAHHHHSGACCSGDHSHGPAGGAGGDMNAAADIMRMLTMRSNATPSNRNAPKTEDELLHKDEWKFWETQPVPQLGSVIPRSVNEPIQPDKSIDEIKKEALSLPDGFMWDDIDINDKAQLDELYTLLNENYVEDDDNMFRFDYSPGFLKWSQELTHHFIMNESYIFRQK